MGKGTPRAAEVTFQGRFAALTRSFELVLGEQLGQSLLFGGAMSDNCCSRLQRNTIC